MFSSLVPVRRTARVPVVALVTLLAVGMYVPRAEAGGAGQPGATFTEQVRERVLMVKGFLYRATHSDSKLIKKIKADSRRAGFKSYEYYAVRSLTDPTQIKEFTRYYLKARPAVASKNIADAADLDLVMTGTAQAWTKALADAQRR